MIISLDFEQLSARLFAAAHARIWPISIVRVFLKLNDGDDDDDDDDDDDEDGIWFDDKLCNNRVHHCQKVTVGSSVFN